MSFLLENYLFSPHPLDWFGSECVNNLDQLKPPTLLLNLMQRQTKMKLGSKKNKLNPPQTEIQAHLLKLISAKYWKDPMIALGGAGSINH